MTIQKTDNRHKLSYLGKSTVIYPFILCSTCVPWAPKCALLKIAIEILHVDTFLPDYFRNAIINFSPLHA